MRKADPEKLDMHGIWRPWCWKELFVCWNNDAVTLRILDVGLPLIWNNWKLHRSFQRQKKDRSFYSNNEKTWGRILKMTPKNQKEQTNLIKSDL